MTSSSPTPSCSSSQVGDALAGGVVAAGRAGVEPRARAGVGDLHVAAREQLGVQVDDPARLPEPLGVGRVGDHLGLGHVQAQRAQRAGHRARAAAARADDEHDAAAGGLGHDRSLSGRGHRSVLGGGPLLLGPRGGVGLPERVVVLELLAQRGQAGAEVGAGGLAVGSSSAPEAMSRHEVSPASTRRCRRSCRGRARRGGPAPAGPGCGGPTRRGTCRARRRGGRRAGAATRWPRWPAARVLEGGLEAGVVGEGHQNPCWAESSVRLPAPACWAVLIEVRTALAPPRPALT